MIILFVLLVLFGVLHSVLADLRVKEWFKGRMGEAFKFYRVAYNIFFAAMLGGIIYILAVTQQPVYVFNPTKTLQYGAIALVIIGTILMIVSFASFDLSEFIGFSYLGEREQKIEKLRIGGLYKYVRHPLYFAIFVLFAGLFLLHPTQMNLVAVGFMYFYTYVGATLEEKKLMQVFGADYVNYRKRVKMLIPFIF